MIPKILHFCFGLSSNGGDWGLLHYACVKSAVERLKPERAFLYYEYRPRGPFWELTTKIIECNKIIAPRAIFGNPLNHHAHRADVLRLQKLIESGGIYLDCDVFVHRGFDDLLDNSVVLGQQGDIQQGDIKTVGLCNAVILAEPGAPFLRRWYSQYNNFRSLGRDSFWHEHSVKLPLQLAAAHPRELTILDPRAFFWPPAHDEGLRRLFASTEPIPRDGVYANHLWESRAWSDYYLGDLTPARVRLIDSNFHQWIRPLIADLPDNLGARSFSSRAMQLLKGRPGDWPGSRIRRVATALRKRYTLIDRTLRNRHHGNLIDPVLRILASLASKQLGSDSNLISYLHRRRTFQSIYRQFLWGEDGKSPFFSGFGSRGRHAELYVEAMVPLLAQHSGASGEELVIVDLGCGDFAVASALLKSLTSLKSLKGVRYIGCDIVPELIDYNQFLYGTARYGSTTVEFRKVDIVRDRLPDAEVCLVRQVLQHLSNAEITTLLPKLSAYKYVYVSEHLPVTPEGMTNPDKLRADTRFDWNSGRGREVELDQPPWNLTLQEIVRTTSAEKNEVIVTHRVVSFDENQRAGVVAPNNRMRSGSCVCCDELTG